MTKLEHGIIENLIMVKLRNGKHQKCPEVVREESMLG
jgi:hypothetical protein